MVAASLSAVALAKAEGGAKEFLTAEAQRTRKKKRGLMFKKPTVFILGAGASSHYGYPTGAELIHEVANVCESFLNATKFFYDTSRQRGLRASSNAHQFLPKYISNKMNGDPNAFLPAIQETIAECQALTTRIKQVDPLVIDYFLNNNSTLQALGKLLISYVILGCDQKEGREWMKKGGNWCRYLVHHMMMGCERPEDFIKYNNVKFVTFNYDRSLERIISNSLNQNDFFPNNSVIDEFLKNDRIIHVYGEIKESKYQPDNVTFEAQFINDFKEKWKNTLDPAYEASEGLLTIAPGDKIKDKTKLKLASDAIEEAKEIFILGYGFDKLNSKNIGLDMHLHESAIRKGYGSEEKWKGKKVYFTNYDNKNVISKKASQIFYSHPSAFLPPNGLISTDRKGLLHYEMSTKSVYEALSEDFEFVD